MTKETMNLDKKFIERFEVDKNKLDDALAIMKFLGSSNSFRVRYLRKDPVVVKKGKGGLKENYELQTGAPYGCVLRFKYMDKEYEGWSLSREKKDSSKKMIRLYAILRAMSGKPDHLTPKVISNLMEVVY